MSRVGRKPIDVPAEVKVTFSEAGIVVEGKKGKLSFSLPGAISVRQEGGHLLVSRAGEGRAERALHGTCRAVLQNMILGVSQGFEKVLSIEGTGYKARNEGRLVVFNLGYSHPILLSPPAGVQVEAVKDTQVFVRGIDKQAVGEVAAKIRKFRPPNPYKGSGVRYKDERIKLKPGKAGA